jgi:hypothetical protein
MKHGRSCNSSSSLPASRPTSSRLRGMSRLGSWRNPIGAYTIFASPSLIALCILGMMRAATLLGRRVRLVVHQGFSGTILGPGEASSTHAALGEGIGRPSSMPLRRRWSEGVGVSGANFGAALYAALAFS